jgi:multisubunit Na+/H+ antiporter MnhB subunit
MARAKTVETDSPYYPPRARWYSRLLVPWFALRRMTHLDRIHLPGPQTCLQFVFSLALPGYAFFPNGRRMLGWAFVAVYGFAAILFIVALGYPIGGVGFGLMIAAHATSIVFLEGYWLREQCRFRIRLVLAVATLLVVWLAVYAPLVGLIERRWVLPLRTAQTVVVVRHAAPESVKRGDWIAFRVPEFTGNGVRIPASFGVEQVLGLAGDRIRFAPDRFEVNGVSHPRRPDMPPEGEWVVPENCWFVWPDMAISGQERAGRIHREQIMRANGMVVWVDFVGKSFHHWFGRRQLP